MTQLLCEDLVLGYEGQAVVSGLSFQVNQGDYLFILGENGSGKSTLIKTLLRLIPPLSGKVELGGGVRFVRDGGWGWVCPDERRPEFRIVAESANAEFARELCDFCEKKLKSLI